jgi:hypothetical protein
VVGFRGQAAQVVVGEGPGLGLGVLDRQALAREVVGEAGLIVQGIDDPGHPVEFVVLPGFGAAQAVPGLQSGLGAGIHGAGQVAVLIVLELAAESHRVDGGGLPAQGVDFELDGFVVGVGDADHVAAQGEHRLGAVAGGVDHRRPAVHRVVFEARAVAFGVRHGDHVAGVIVAVAAGVALRIGLGLDPVGGIEAAGDRVAHLIAGAVLVAVGHSFGVMFG